MDEGAAGADTSNGGAPTIKRPGTNFVSRCRVPRSPGASTAALVRQFGVNDFALVRADDGNVFHFEAKASAEIVVCALFACSPVIRDRVIQNAATCVVAKKPFTQQEGSFDLNDPLLLKNVSRTVELCEDEDATSPAPGRSRPARHAPYLTQLSVGCWAYDDTALIGATLLVPVRADAAIESRFGLRSDCQPRVVDTLNTETPPVIPVDGENCTLPATDMIGTCSGGYCRQRCLADSDCVPPKRLGVAAPECPPPTEGASGAAGSGPSEAGGASGAGGAVAELPLAPLVCEHPFGGAIGQCFRRCETRQ